MKTIMLVIAFTDLVAPLSPVGPVEVQYLTPWLDLQEFFLAVWVAEVFTADMKSAAHDNAPLWMPLILTSSICHTKNRNYHLSGSTQTLLHSQK